MADYPLSDEDGALGPQDLMKRLSIAVMRKIAEKTTGDGSMEQNFHNIANKILGIEGGFNDHPNDTPTNLGVTQQTYDTFRKMNGLDPKSVKDIDETEAKQVYKTLFFDKVEGGKLPDKLDAVVFDAAINSGPKQAIMTLQSLLGLEPDGLIGDKTLEKVQTVADVKSFAHKFLDEREKFYKTLARNRPEKRAFLDGWLNRVKKLRSIIG